VPVGGSFFDFIQSTWSDVKTILNLLQQLFENLKYRSKGQFNFFEYSKDEFRAWSKFEIKNLFNVVVTFLNEIRYKLPVVVFSNGRTKLCRPHISPDSQTVSAKFLMGYFGATYSPGDGG